MTLYSHNGSVPAVLPNRYVDINGDVFFGLDNRLDEQLAEWGFTPEPIRPDYDSATQRLDWQEGAWIVSDLPPPPEPEPRPLTKLEFIGLAQAAGGMTDAQLVAAQADPAFAAFWIKYQMASDVSQGHPTTLQSLDALAASGYLPNGSEAVLAAWPTA